MIVDFVVYAVIILATYFAWRKYQDRSLHWCLWVAIVGLAAVIVQHLIEFLFPFPSVVQFGALVAIETLRLVFLVLLVTAIIRIFRR